MKKRIYLRVGENRYPCYETMGGNVIYEEESGANMLKGLDFSELTASKLCLFFWSRCKGACKREGMDFPYSLEQFIDTIEEEDLLHAINEMAGVSPSDSPEGSEDSDRSKKA